MYTTLMMLVALLAPIPALIKSIKERTTPFRAVLQGIITGVVAALVVMVVADLAGSNVFDELYEGVNAMVGIMANDPNMIAVLGEGLTEAERVKALSELYSQAIQMLPGVLFVVTAVVSYFDYIIISKIYKPGGIAAIPMTKLREFNLPRNIAFVWIAFYLISLLITGAGIIGNNILFLNINYIFDFAFCIQGFSLVLMFCYSKRIPQGLGFLVAFAVYMTGIGQTILMFVGFTDIVFGIKQRMKRVA